MSFSKYATSLADRVLTLQSSLKVQSSLKARSSLKAHAPPSLERGIGDLQLAACVILAQEEAGSGACIDPAGLILTCAHCVPKGVGQVTPIIFATTGNLYSAHCVHWDERMDCALLKVDALRPHYSPAKKKLVRTTTAKSAAATFPFLPLASAESGGDGKRGGGAGGSGSGSGGGSGGGVGGGLDMNALDPDVPPEGTDVVCVGQPSAHDMESKRPRRTGYPPVYITSGKLRGYIGLPPACSDPDERSDKESREERKECESKEERKEGESREERKEPRKDERKVDEAIKVDEAVKVGGKTAAINYFDNYEIGCLMHDCHTYWGSSGSPLISSAGKLVGMHSSWDDETGMRHGVPLPAIRRFLQVHKAAAAVEK